MEDLKSAARRAKRRLKTDYWKKCKENADKTTQKARVLGLNEGKVKSGIYGKVLSDIRGEKPDLLQEKVDPNAEEIRALKCRVHKLEAALQKLTGETFECSEEELFPVSAPFPEEKIPVTEAEPIAEAPADGGPPETGEEKPAADEIADKAADEKADEKREGNDEKESKEE